MSETINYYNVHAKEFFEGTVAADMSCLRDKFLKYIPVGGRLLDAGCGSGRDSKVFIQSGYKVEAIDASVELCKLASENIGQEVHCLCFNDMKYKKEFDGIWASASLLHVAKNDMQGVLVKCYNALKPDGILYASFKYGDTEAVKNKRLFNNYTEEGIKDLFYDMGIFRILECFVTEDVRAERTGEKWVNVIAKKI